ncbi:hypothetical protein MKEN_00129800 [Mycena kentingensis (nom. inval.)]|nr:hypothetical protein MKEN_00129800 [Mycena kentingensis (nom. inval.)]
MTTDNNPLEDSLPFKFMIESYLHMTIFASFLHGIYTALFFATLYGMVVRKRMLHHRRLCTVVVALYALSTVEFAYRWWMTKTVFIDHEGSPFSEFSWRIVVPNTALLLSFLIADGLIIWRCWVICGRQTWYIILPSLCAILGVVFGFIGMAQGIALTFEPASWMSPFQRFNVTTIGYALCIIPTPTATFIIILRILLLSKAADVSSGPTWSYRKIIEAIIESALLYSITLLVLLLMIVKEQFWTAGYAQIVLGRVIGFAPTLLIARVLWGASPSEEYWSTRGPSSTLIFAHRDGGLMHSSEAASDESIHSPANI